MKARIFQDILYNWHSDQNFSHPWKLPHKNLPYHTWVSEIILQQTQVQTGLTYYKRFIQRFPNLKSLADAHEDDVLKIWEGMGYYSRARNLHAAARDILQNRNGKFPSTYKEILSMKGVGPYTAAAISSFAFNLPHVAIDGNLYRVLTRIFGISEAIDTKEGKEEVRQRAESLLDYERPGHFNQALMDFGREVCKPRRPDCANCPFQNCCEALTKDLTHFLPHKSKTIRKRDRHFHFIVVEKGGIEWIQKREQSDIWKGLFQYPLIETSTAKEDYRPFLNNCIGVEEKGMVYQKSSRQHKQSLSHQNIFAHFHHYSIQKDLKKAGLVKCEKAALAKFAFPKVIHCYLWDK